MLLLGIARETRKSRSNPTGKIGWGLTKSIKCEEERSDQTPRREGQKLFEIATEMGVELSEKRSLDRERKSRQKGRKQ